MHGNLIDGVVREIVMEHARLPIDDLTDDKILGADTGFDSLALVRAMAALEDRLGIVFPLERLESIRHLTYGELVVMVREQVEDASRRG